jgi:hypothetical protein
MTQSRSRKYSERDEVFIGLIKLRDAPYIEDLTARERGDIQVQNGLWTLRPWGSFLARLLPDFAKNI